MRNLFFIPLEERIVLDAALGVELAAAPEPTAVELLVISNALPDQAILDNAVKETTRVVHYDPSTASLDALSNAIIAAIGGQPIEKIGFISEGSIGHFGLLDNLSLNIDTLNNNREMQAFWKEIASYVSPEGSIDLLSCNTASGTSGKSFADSFATFLRNVNSTITLHASDDLTGYQPLGGDWILEYSSDGHQYDAAAAFFYAEPLALWDHLLLIARPFTTRYSTTVFGDIRAIGNVLLTDNGTSTDGDNNTAFMSYIDIDGDAATFNSSSANLSLPSGSNVLWAGLYCAGNINKAASNNNALLGYVVL